MTNFTPDGSLVVAFENGEVRMWQASVSLDALKDTRRDRQSRIRTAVGYDIAEIPNLQFDLKDKFDMHDPFGVDANLKEMAEQNSDRNEEQKLQIAALAPPIIRCRQTEVTFGPSGSDVDTYFCWTAVLNCIFIRRYRAEEESQRFQKITLSAAPTSMHVGDYMTVAHNFTLQQRGGYDYIVAVGTVEGRVELWLVGSIEPRLIAKSRIGMLWGEVSDVCLNDKGEELIVTSSASELVYFELQNTWLALREQEEAQQKARR